MMSKKQLISLIMDEFERNQEKERLEELENLKATPVWMLRGIWKRIRNQMEKRVIKSDPIWPGKTAPIDRPIFKELT